MLRYAMLNKEETKDNLGCHNGVVVVVDVVNVVDVTRPLSELMMENAHLTFSSRSANRSQEWVSPVTHIHHDYEGHYWMAS